MKQVCGELAALGAPLSCPIPPSQTCLASFFVAPGRAIVIASLSRRVVVVGFAAHGSLGELLGLAESGAELPVGLARGGDPQYLGALLIAPALAPAPAKPRQSLLQQAPPITWRPTIVPYALSCLDYIWRRDG